MIKTFTSENLKILRKRKHLTQDDLSSALGLNRATYSGYENGISSPSIDTIVSIANYYGITLDDLIKTELRLVNEFQFRQIISK
jgi:transcriptional regulator with XRE-family HTH domain